MVGGQTDESVVCFGVVFVYKVHVVCGDYLYVVFPGQSYELRLNLFLAHIHIVVGAWLSSFVALKLNVVVVAECVFEPFYRALGTLDVAGLQQTRNFAAKTCRRYYQAFAMLCKLFFVGARMFVEALCPGLRHEFYKVFVSSLVFGEYHKVSATVVLVAAVGEGVVCHIHLAAENGLEVLSLHCCFCGLNGLGVVGCLGLAELFAGFCHRLFHLFVVLLYVVEKLFCTEHVAMVGHSNRRHAVGYGLFDKAADSRKAVEQRV